MCSFGYLFASFIDRWISFTPLKAWQNGWIKLDPLKFYLWINCFEWFELAVICFLLEQPFPVLLLACSLMKTDKHIYATARPRKFPLYRIYPFMWQTSNRMCHRAIKFAFSKIFKLPSSLRDSNNFVKTLKICVKLTLNCPHTHAITCIQIALHSVKLLLLIPGAWQWKNCCAQHFILRPLSFM